VVLPSNIPFGVIQLSHNNNGDIELQSAGKQRHNENKGIILGRCFTALIDFVVSANMPASCTYKAFCYGCIIHIMFLPRWLLFILRAFRAHNTAGWRLSVRYLHLSIVWEYWAQESSDNSVRRNRHVNTERHSDVSFTRTMTFFCCQI
jgi:hypothetical protein